MDPSIILSALKAFSLYKSQKNLDKILSIIGEFRDEQTYKWNLLQTDIDSLKRGPFYSGKTLLKDASKPHRNEDEKCILIEQARMKFIDALGICESKSELTSIETHQKAYIQYHIALCWFLLGKQIDALDWVTVAITDIESAEATIMSRIEDKKDKIKQHQDRIAEIKAKSVKSNPIFVYTMVATSVLTGPVGAVMGAGKVLITTQRINNEKNLMEEVIFKKNQLEKIYKITNEIKEFLVQTSETMQPPSV